MTALLAAASVGDVLDRLTILDLKVRRLRDDAARARVEVEREALRRAWQAGGLPEPTSVPEHTALAAVNTALWDVEDALRTAEAAGDFGADFVTLARSVYQQNDRRAALKRAVNERFGSAIFEEKQHPSYGEAEAVVAAPATGAATLTHIDAAGNARMVEVGDKAVTRRSATAEGWVRLSAEALDAVVSRRARKGDVLGVAQVAGIMAAKRTGELIPLCHPLALDGIDLSLEPKGDGIHLVATVRCTGRTGVEMEALTAVSVAALTVYDMLKAVDRGMRVEGVRLVAKSGGKSGEWGG